MLFSRHIYWTTLGHILFILATAGTGLWLIISQQGVVIGILLVICSLFQIGRLVNKLNSFNQKLRLFFDAIEDKDNMLYFPRKQCQPGTGNAESFTQPYQCPAHPNSS